MAAFQVIINGRFWVITEDIKDYLSVDAIKAKHILLISDSCFAGDFFRSYRGKLPNATPEVVKKAWELQSRQVITSGGLEPVSDDGFGGHSVFAHFLLRALRQNNKPFLISSDLFPDLRASVSQNADQLPSFGSLRDTGSQLGGELVLFLKQSTSLGDLDADVSERSEELAQLRNLELAAQQTRASEEAAIAKHEEQLARLDAEITALRESLGTAARLSDDSFETLLAMAQERKKQRDRIEALRQDRKAEEAKRRADIALVKAEARDRHYDAVAKDLSMYEKIAALDATMGEEAWRKLQTKYPVVVKGVAAGDAEALRKLVNRPKPAGQRSTRIRLKHSKEYCRWQDQRTYRECMNE